MKQVTLKVSNCSVAQWSTLLLELNLVSKNWARFGPRIELQATSIKRIVDQGTSNKPQAKGGGMPLKSGHKRHNMARFI